jgi:hypothetical protein
MRVAFLGGLAGALLPVLSGCSLLVGLQNQQNEFLVSAEPLLISPEEWVVSPRNKREFLGRVVFQSEQKCVSFLNRLTLARNTVDTTGDILSAGLSGLAALVTPLATSHALSGAATFVTGSKAAIDADIYAKASLTSFQSALQQSYFNFIKKYTTDLDTMSEDAITVSNEVAKIQSIHAACALAPAESAIQATISSPAPPPGGASGNPPAAALPPAPAAAPPRARMRRRAPFPGVLPAPEPAPQPAPSAPGAAATQSVVPGGRLH